MPLKAYTLREKPDLEPDFDRLAEEAWPRALVIAGTVPEWEAWAEMAFPLDARSRRS